ncbi:MAG: NAD(P)-binding domain-containing protein, partial [Acidobacteriales bacterium]|nr:NAD(P)-binding domain-containing protein [Terriglobales bacterium]
MRDSSTIGGMTQSIALFGLGSMGAGMAGQLLRHGFSLNVWNRNSERAAPFVQQGARAAASPQQAAAGADVIVSMVADDNASRAVWLGENGALAAARPGAVLIE